MTTPKSYKRVSKKRQSKKDFKRYSFKSYKPYGVKADPFPRSLMTTMTFNADRTLTSGASYTSGTAYPYRLNSIYGCESSGGKTTAGWAQMVELYDNYIVMGAKVTLRFVDPSADNMMLIASTNQTQSLSTQLMSDIPGFADTRTKFINNTGRQVARISFRVATWQLMGLSKQEYMSNRSSYQSAINANPSGSVFLTIANACGSATATVYVNVNIQYNVLFFNRNSLVQSSVV